MGSPPTLLSARRGVNKMMLSSLPALNHIYCLSALLLALCTLSALPATQVGFADSSLTSALQKMKISPDIVSISDKVSTIKIVVASGPVKPGETVQVKNFRDLPEQISWYSNIDARYTLLLVDLDRVRANAAGPSNQSAQHTNIYNQYTTLNMPGDRIVRSQVVVAFETPVLPCHVNTKHRLLMLALHQPQTIDLADVNYMWASSGVSSKRENFSINDFINRLRLDLVAANAFYVSSDPGVCSGSGSTLRSTQGGGSTMISIAMVTAAASFFAWSNSNKRQISML